MNTRQWRSRLVLILLLALTHICSAADAPVDVSGDIAGILTSLQEQTGVPAYSVAIVRDGQILAQTAVGEVDIRNHFDVTPRHRFRIASVSKVVAATMLALLVQSGELDPHAPISNYAQELPEQYQDLTALQLLSHTSGLPHYQSRDAGIAKTHYANAIESLVSVGDRALVATPGDSYLYSSHGFTILGALYESITGVPLTAAAPEFVKALSGRETPVLEDLWQRDSRRSNVFDVTAGGTNTVKPRDQSYSPFATGFTATATDLAYFGDTVLHSGRINDETRELLFRPVALNGGGKTGTYLYEVAFGWRIGMDSSGRTVYHHAGITEGARSVLVLYPEFGLSIVFLSNASWTAQIERTAFALANIVLERQSIAMPNEAQKFSGSFDGHAISGTLSCEEGTESCRLSDNQGALTEWLRQYAPGKESPPDWPAIPVEGSAGQALKLVTTVGIVELRRNSIDPDFTAEIGNGRMLVIRIGAGSFR